MNTPLFELPRARARRHHPVRGQLGEPGLQGREAALPRLVRRGGSSFERLRGGGGGGGTAAVLCLGWRLRPLRCLGHGRSAPLHTHTLQVVVGLQVRRLLRGTEGTSHPPPPPPLQQQQQRRARQAARESGPVPCCRCAAAPLPACPPACPSTHPPPRLAVCRATTNWTSLCGSTSSSGAISGATGRPGREGGGWSHRRRLAIASAARCCAAARAAAPPPPPLFPLPPFPRPGTDGRSLLPQGMARGCI